MKIDVTTLETPELLQLIATASSELQKRVIAGTAVIERRTAEPVVIVVNEPCKSDQELAKRILCLRRKNGFVLADERREYKRIVGGYPDWKKSNNMPDDVSGSAYDRWGRLHGS